MSDPLLSKIIYIEQASEMQLLADSLKMIHREKQTPEEHDKNVKTVDRIYELAQDMAQEVPHLEDDILLYDSFMTVINIIKDCRHGRSLAVKILEPGIGTSRFKARLQEAYDNAMLRRISNQITRMKNEATTRT